MRMNKLRLALVAVVAVSFLASSSLVTCPDASGGLWDVIFGGSSDESEEVMEADDRDDSEAGESTDKGDPRAVATHKQAVVIKVTTDEDKNKSISLHDFCLDADGNILAAVGGDPGEIRVYEPEGKYLATWSIPVRVEAIGMGPDGHIYVGGGGKLLKLDGDGKVVLEVDAPHVASLKSDAGKLRETIVKQHEQQAKMIGQQVEMYEKEIEKLEKKIEKQEEERKDLEASRSDEEPDEKSTESAEDPEDTDVEQRAATAKKMKSIDRRLVLHRKTLKAYRNGLESMKKYAEQVGGKEITDEEIDTRVEAMIRRKQSVSSISAAGGDVYVTCGASAGYGFDIWRTDEQFENAEKIVEGLSGCCGQMDARCGPDGLFVAENGRHRVRKYDRDGELIKSWGKSARKGLKGFGGCCNPKNIAFGPKGDVYTVEDTNGRIKRYSPDGELLGLVGTAQIGPGCLDISVAVDKSGDWVYMLDTDANHIVLLKRKESVSGDEKAGG